MEKTNKRLLIAALIVWVVWAIGPRFISFVEWTLNYSPVPIEQQVHKAPEPVHYDPVRNTPKPPSAQVHATDQMYYMTTASFVINR